MKKSRIKKLKKSGWQVGGVKEFLNLSEADLVLIDIKRSLINKIKTIRKNNSITQQALAKLLSSSQSRVAKFEADPTGGSIELLIRALIALGMTRRELASTIEIGK